MTARTSRRLLLGTLAAAAGVLVTTLATPAPPPAAADDGWPGQAGVDTSLPPTDSAVSVEGRGAFDGMEVTVNQTEDLTNQAISITWRGAPPTVSEPTTFHSNFLQVMQCWGEPDAQVPENPGPPPEQCVWGALNPAGGGAQEGFATHLVTGRAFTNRVFENFDPAIGTVDADSGDVYRDFVAVDGTVITDHVDATASGPFDRYWVNSAFDSIKTNELPGVRTLADGRGQALFTINTGLESSGLGCGQRVQPSAGGEPTIPRCWLVIVPRSTPEVENEGLPFQPSQGVASSPMAPGRWSNRIAIELQFTPIDSPCALAADLRLINGMEMALRAVVSWQPVLCTQPGRLPFAYGIISDGLARQQLVSDGQGAPGMITLSRPPPDGASTPDDPIVYAPLAVSAISIGFNVDRVGVGGGTDDRRLQGVRYARLNLTPRLVAKLLTQSYRSQVQIANSDPYDWDDDNPIVLFRDPDFLQFNPEYALWQPGSPVHGGGLILPAGISDLASQVWEWILGDPEAAEWLAGEPDEWGMVVNPVYATTAENNSTGLAFGSPPPDSFPKSDPYCYQAPALSSGTLPPTLCGLDWLPYATGFGEAARLAAVANDGSRTRLNPFAVAPHEVWKPSGPQQLGRRTIISVTDLPSVSRYGLQAARLSIAGDNGPDREFVAPDEAGLDRAVRSMSDEGGLLHLDPADVDRGAYPLTTLTYAAIRPLSLDAEARDDYAAFLEHAAGPGQEPGLDLGQLPPGYHPLPAELAAATSAAAHQVRTLQSPAAPENTTTTTQASGSTSPVQTSPGSSGGVRSSPRSSRTPEAAAPSPGGDTAAPALPVSSSESSRGGLTPIAAVGNGRFAVVAVAVVALVSALIALEITKRPRRRSDHSTPPSLDPATVSDP